MSGTREQITQALLARLTAAAAWGASGRRNRDPNNIASPNEPALLLIKHHEHYERVGHNMPPRRTMNMMAIVYIDAGSDENGIPDAILNPIQDAIDAALAPDTPQGFCTLGGLVASCIIAGEVTNAPGDMTGKGLAIIPIDILIP
jgi:hypothetical protein